MVDAAISDNIQQYLPGAQTKSDKAKASLSNDLDDFLKLLTTQLKNQDPTQPLDTAQFTQQIATLSSVEQQINANANLEKLVNLYSSSQVDNVVGYIGRRVETTGNKSLVAGGVGLFIYDLPQEASEVEISIQDSNGNVVFSGEGDTKAGRNEVLWGGINSFTQEQMPDGVYNITVKARDFSGSQLGATTYTTGRVTAVDLQDGEPTLLMGDHEIPINQVRNIREDVVNSSLLAG